VGSAKCGTLALALLRGVIVAASDGALPLPSIVDRPSFLRDAGLSVQDGVLLELAPPSRGVAGQFARGVDVPPRAVAVRCCWLWPFGGGVCLLHLSVARDSQQACHKLGWYWQDHAVALPLVQPRGQGQTGQEAAQRGINKNLQRVLNFADLAQQNFDALLACFVTAATRHREH